MATKLAAGFLFLTGIFLSVAPAVNAHVQENSNGISAVLHILPDDNPAAEELTYMQLTFGGTDLDVAACGCRLQVRSAARTVEDVVLEPLGRSRSVGHASVTFPEAGAYTLAVSGQGNDGRFSLQFITRVQPAGGTAVNRVAGVQVVLVSVASLIVLARIGFYNIARGMRYTSVK